MVRTVTLRYYLLAVVHYCGLNMTSAMFMAFLLTRGLDEREAMLAYAFYFIALTSVEIPTGAGSDVGGRKRAFMLACGLNACSMIAYAFSESFLAFACAATLGGIGTAFANGTLDSWFVTQLKRTGGAEQSFDLIFTKAELFKSTVAAIAGFVGIKLAGSTLQVPWFIAAVSFVGTGAFAFFLMHEKDFEGRRHASLEEMWSAIKRTMREGVAYGLANKKIGFLVTAVAALYAAVMIPNMLWQPHFLQWLPDRESLGYVWLAMMVANGLGMLLVMVPRLLGFEMYDRKTLLVCLTAIGTGIFGMACFGNFADSLIFFLLYQAGRGAFQPINRAFLHRNIKTEEVRTTVSSMEAIGHHIGAALGLIVGSQLVYFVSREAALLSAGGFLIVFVALRWRHRKSA